MLDNKPTQGLNIVFQCSDYRHPWYVCGYHHDDAGRPRGVRVLCACGMRSNQRRLHKKSKSGRPTFTRTSYL